MTDPRRTEQLADTSARRYYDAYWKTEGWTTRPPAKLLELFAHHVSANDHVLDVGCGDGGTSGVWLSTHAASYLGADISATAVRAARARGLDARQIEDAAELPFDDSSFDVAICVEVLEHLFEPQRALADIGRVLRSGGRAIVTVPNAAHWRSRLDLAVLGRWNARGDHLSPTEPWRDPHVRFFTVDSLANLLEHCGFEILEHGGFSELAFSQYVPGLRRMARTGQARPIARRLASRFPRILAGNLYAVGRA